MPSLANALRRGFSSRAPRARRGGGRRGDLRRAHPPPRAVSAAFNGAAGATVPPPAAGGGAGGGLGGGRRPVGPRPLGDGGAPKGADGMAAATLGEMRDPGARQAPALDG